MNHTECWKTNELWTELPRPCEFLPCGQGTGCQSRAANLYIENRAVQRKPVQSTTAAGPKLVWKRGVICSKSWLPAVAMPPVMLPASVHHLLIAFLILIWFIKFKCKSVVADWMKTGPSEIKLLRKIKVGRVDPYFILFQGQLWRVHGDLPWFA